MNPTHRIFVTIVALLTITLLMALAPTPTWAQTSSLYKLTENSGYVEGCFDPCMCPIFWNPTLQGSFQLTAIPPDPGTAHFEVTAIDWQFIMGEEIITVTGSGHYQIESDQHRMILDLLVGDGPAQQFDSGLVPLESEVPGIFIAVALNGFYCYDYVFDIAAVPAPVEDAASSWGSLKSTYR
jgi:hypothetical protein